MWQISHFISCLGCLRVWDMQKKNDFRTIIHEVYNKNGPSAHNKFLILTPLVYDTFLPTLKYSWYSSICAYQILHWNTGNKHYWGKMLISTFHVRDNLRHVNFQMLDTIETIVFSRIYYQKVCERGGGQSFVIVQILECIKRCSHNAILHGIPSYTRWHLLKVILSLKGSNI